MTYLAPRQGLFAIILTLSFFLHTLLLVVSTKHQINETYQKTGERVVQQLVQESKLALSTQDKVSLSVLANRYTSEFDVVSIVIEDANNKVLVRVGNAPLQQGLQISQVVMFEDAPLGEVILMLKAKGTGEIIAKWWPYILGSLVMHILIWLIYGYTARPTHKQLSNLSREVQEHYTKLHSRPLRERRNEPKPKTDGRLDTSKDATAENYTLGDLQKELVQSDSDLSVSDILLKSRKRDKEEAPSTPKMSDKKTAHDDSLDIHYDETDIQRMPTLDIEEVVKGDVEALKDDKDSARSRAAEAVQRTKNKEQLIDSRNMEIVSVQIRFDDEDNLLATLAPEKSQPYFALCTQLLEQTISDLLRQPLLFGVTLENKPAFDASGAIVKLRASGEHGNVALGAVMLGKLYVMLNQIVYVKHRELKRFALNVYVGISDEALMQPMSQLIEYHAKTDDVLVLLPSAGIKQLTAQVQLRSLPRPTTVYERECGFVIGMSNNMMQRLVSVRNDVLLSGQ